MLSHTVKRALQPALNKGLQAATKQSITASSAVAFNSTQPSLKKKTEKKANFWQEQPGFGFEAKTQGASLRNPVRDIVRAKLNPKRLEVAVLDWSGTVADNFVIAPAFAFVEVFGMFGVNISMEEARVPMGLRKDLHIKALTEMESVRAKWFAKHARNPTQADVDAMFKKFIPAQLKCLPNYTGLIPGAAQAVQRLKDEFGLKIGSTTGFQRVMVDVLVKDGREQGFHPDVTVAGDEAIAPRPYPYIVFKNMELLGAMNMRTVVKVDDTKSGVLEGVNAGCWSVGISHTSNYMNINTIEEFMQMTPDEFEKRGQNSKEILMSSGCHYVIRDITQLPEVVHDINLRMDQGESPAN